MTNSLTRCTSCGREVPANSQVCAYCGTRLAGTDEQRLCSSCGNRTLAEEQFCGYCGTSISRESNEELNSIESEQRVEPEPPQFAHKATSAEQQKTKVILIVGAGFLLLIVGFLLFARHSKSPQSNQSAAANAPESATPPSRIITKDAEWGRLLHPPTGEDDILANNQAFVQKKQEIEAKLSQVSDSDLRERLASEEWGKVDKQSYMAEGEENLRASWSAAMRSFLERHRADWFEIGHVDYPGSGSLLVKSVDASPLEVPDGETIPLDIATMDSVYSKFRELAKGQIEEMGRNWVYEQSCQAKLRNVCINLGGSESECSDTARLSEIEQSLPGVLAGSDCNDNASLEDGMKAVEAKMRSERIILVGQGDLVTQRIDKVMLVDYDTETILHDFGQSPLNPLGVGWKFSDANGTGRTLLTAYDFLTGTETDGKSVHISNPGTFGESASTLKDVDFKNRTYTVDGMQLDIRAGHYKHEESVGYQEAKIDDTWFVSDAGSSPQFAVVSFWYVGCGASCTSLRYIQVFNLDNHQLELVQELGFDVEAKGAGVWFDANSRRLTIRARSNDDSPHCCAKSLDLAEFVWNGQAFTLDRAVTIPVEP